MRGRVFRQVSGLRRGPLRTHRNGTTAHEWAVLDLVCGHHVVRERLKNPRRRRPGFAHCAECSAAAGRS